MPAGASMPGPERNDPLQMADLLLMAQRHGESTGTREWVDDPERMLAVAWDLMDDAQRHAFREHADVLAVAEAGAT